MRRWLAVCLVPAIATAAPVLDRDPGDYFVFAERTATVTNLFMEPPGCSIGVNCPRPGVSNRCGVLHMSGAVIPQPGQVAGDYMCGPGTLFELFRNGPGFCAPTCATIVDPGPASDCSTPFATPILGDLDGDGTPSCTAPCTVDAGDLAAACGVTLPFPPCNAGRPVFVGVDQDCSIGDTMPGNHRCDLMAGTYGPIVVKTGARINFEPGTTVVCSLLTGKAVRVTSSGPATVLVPGRGNVRLGSLSDVGGLCGDLSIVTEAGKFQMGKFGDYSLDGCSVSGRVALGHGNTLTGHFRANSVISDIDNTGRCCASSFPPPPTTTTSTPPTTTTTSSTSTTTTTTSTTTTAPTPTTTTTSTTTEPTPSTTTTSTSPTPTTTSTAPTPTTTTTSTTTTTTTPTPTTTTTTVPTPTTTSTTTTITTTTLAGGAFTRTIGFYKNHPNVTESILAASGGVTVCGHSITDVHVAHGHSAIEAMCVSPQGDLRLHLAAQLTAAAINMAAGGASFADFSSCNATCANPTATDLAVSECITSSTDFNQSGDNVVAPFDPAGASDSGACSLAFDTACTLLQPSLCAVP